MATLVTLANLQQWVLFPQDKQTASVTLMDGSTPIVEVTAVSGGLWGSSVTVAVTHGLLTTWDLALVNDAVEQDYNGCDTALGINNLASVIAGVTDPQIGMAKLNNGRPDEGILQLEGGRDERIGLDISELIQGAELLVSEEERQQHFFTRNPDVAPLLNSYLGSLEPPLSDWSELDAAGQAAFLDALLAAIDD